MDESDVVLPQGGGLSQSETRSHVQRILLNGSSKHSSAHVSSRKGSNTNSMNSSEKEETLSELPQVHSSPRKQNTTTEIKTAHL